MTATRLIEGAVGVTADDGLAAAAADPAWASGEASVLFAGLILGGGVRGAAESAERLCSPILRRWARQRAALPESFRRHIEALRIIAEAWHLRHLFLSGVALGDVALVSPQIVQSPEPSIEVASRNRQATRGLGLGHEGLALGAQGRRHPGDAEKKLQVAIGRRAMKVLIQVLRVHRRDVSASDGGAPAAGVLRGVDFGRPAARAEGIDRLVEPPVMATSRGATPAFRRLVAAALTAALCRTVAWSSAAVLRCVRAGLAAARLVARVRVAFVL